MIFGTTKPLKEAEETEEVLDAITTDGAEDADEEAIADQVNGYLEENALDAVAYFTNGEEFQREYVEAANVLTEARKLSKNTYVRLNKNDDLARRESMACILLARQSKDPLFKKYAIARHKERALRKQIFAKYRARGARIAKLSQKKHIADMRKLPPLPMIKR